MKSALLALVLMLAVSTSASAESFRGVSTFVLKESLMVQPGWARSFVQGGERRKFSELDQWTTYCSVEVNTLADKHDRIYIGTGVYQVLGYRLSQPFLGAFAWSNLRDNPWPVDIQIDFKLRGDADPDVIRLRCNRTVEAYSPLGFTWQQINRAFGEIGSLQ